MQRLIININDEKDYNITAKQNTNGDIIIDIDNISLSEENKEIEKNSNDENINLYQKRTINELEEGMDCQLNGLPTSYKILNIDRNKDTALLIANNSVANMKFGPNNKYDESFIKHYLENTYLSNIKNSYPNSVLPMGVQLCSDSGEDIENIGTYEIAIPNTWMIRTFRNLIVNGQSFYTLTPLTLKEYDSQLICAVDADDCIVDRNVDGECGVRPVILVRSNIEVII